jgi:hypothetical protein
MEYKNIKYINYILFIKSLWKYKNIVSSNSFFFFNDFVQSDQLYRLIPSKATMKLILISIFISIVENAGDYFLFFLHCYEKT